MVYTMTSKVITMGKERLPSQDDSMVKLKRTRRPADGSDEGQDSSSTQGEKLTSQSLPTKKGGATNLENNYRMSSVGVKFQARDVEHLVEDILVKNLKDVAYNPTRCKRLSQELAALIMEKIKSIQIKRYKLVAVVSIGSIKERPGMQFGSRCLWNQETDTFASVKFTNGSLFAVAMVYGLYYE